VIVDSEFSRKKLLAVGALLLVLVGVPVTVYMALHRQSSNSHASTSTTTEDTVVVTINGEQVTKAQVRAVAQETYEPSAVDTQALNDALDTIEERKILDNAATTYSLTPDTARVQKYTQQDFSDTEAHYAALREQVILKAVNSREASSVGFWNPPTAGVSSLSVTEKDTAATQLASGIPALTTAEDMMKAGKTPAQIADAILKNKPELGPVFATNGYIYSTLTSDGKVMASYPQIYEFGDPGVDSQTRDALFAQDQGAVVKVTDTEGNKGGNVFKIEVKGNVTGAATYDDWLTSQKASLVKPITPL
jgi:hypothetical protein